MYISVKYYVFIYFFISSFFFAWYIRIVIGVICVFGNIKEYSVLEVTKKVIEKNKVSFDEFAKKDLKEIALEAEFFKRLEKENIMKNLA